MPRLSSAASTPSRRWSRAATPSFWPASRQRSSAQSVGGASGSAEAAGVDQQPERGEVGEVLAFEDAAQVGLDIGGAREAGVVAHEAQVRAVGSEAPERAVAGVEPVLQRGGGRAAAAVVARCALGRSRSSAGGTTTTGTRPPSASSVTANCALAERAGADAANVGEAEDVAQQLLDETRLVAAAEGASLAVELGKQRLADAEVARDLVAQRQALGDAVVGLGLCAGLVLGDARQHRRRDQRAFDRDGVEGERRWTARARAISVPRRTRTKRPITSAGSTGSTVTRALPGGGGAHAGVVLGQRLRALARIGGDRTVEQRRHPLDALGRAAAAARPARDRRSPAVSSSARAASAVSRQAIVAPAIPGERRGFLRQQHALAAAVDGRA